MAVKAKKRHRHKKGQRGSMAIIACVVMILCVVLMYNSVQLNQRLEKEKAIAESLQERIEDQEELKAALEEKADYMQSEEYYKELAREKLGLAGENDIIFKKSE